MKYASRAATGSFFFPLMCMFRPLLPIDWVIWQPAILCASQFSPHVSGQKSSQKTRRLKHLFSRCTHVVLWWGMSDTWCVLLVHFSISIQSIAWLWSYPTKVVYWTTSIILSSYRHFVLILAWTLLVAHLFLFSFHGTSSSLNSHNPAFPSCASQFVNWRLTTATQTTFSLWPCYGRWVFWFRSQQWWRRWRQQRWLQWWQQWQRQQPASSTSSTSDSRCGKNDRTGNPNPWSQTPLRAKAERPTGYNSFLWRHLPNWPRD